MFIRKFKQKICNTLIGIGISALLAVPSYGMATKPQKIVNSASQSAASSTTPSAAMQTLPPLPPGQTAVRQYCPLAKELTKTELYWTVGEAWRSYSESFVAKIDAFVGAQWVGVKVGKIICLYQGKDSFDFPVALEQVKSKIIFEPSGTHWSALVNNRRFCKSNNVFDCPYLVQTTEEVKEIYKTIEYQPQTHNATGNLDFQEN